MNRKVSRRATTVALAGFVLMFLPLVVARAQDNLKQFENFDFATKQLKGAEINNLPLDDLKFLRGIVFGRHGRVFKDAEIKAYLENQAWYKPNAGFQNSMLNDV